MSGTYCEACDLVDCVGNSACLECYGPTRLFERAEYPQAASVLTGNPTFTSALSGREQVLADRRGPRSVLDLLDGITNAASRIERAKERA